MLAQLLSQGKRFGNAPTQVPGRQGSTPSGGFGLPGFGGNEDPSAFLNDFVSQALAKEHERMNKEEEKLFQKHQELEKKRSMLQPPQQKPPIGKNDLLPMLILAGLAKALGAKDRDLAEGGVGFLQGRQQYGQMQDTNAARRFEQENANISNESNSILNEMKFRQGQANDFQQREQAMRAPGIERAKDERNFQQQMELERYRQGQLTGRAQIRDPKKVEYYKMLSKTPEGRALLTQAVVGNDPDAIEAAQQLTEAEKLTRARTTNIDAKTATENQMRPWKVGRAKVEVDKALAQVSKIRTDTELVRKKVDNYDDEFQLRVANVYSQMARRSAQTANDAKKTQETGYWGKGFEASFEQLKNIAERQMTIIIARNPMAIMGQWSNPEDEAAYRNAEQDYKTAMESLERVQQEKASRARTYSGGGNAAPPKSIDTSGGAGALNAPFKPNVPGVTDKPGAGAFAGAKAGARKSSTKKPQPQRKAGTTKSGVKFEFEP